MTAVLEELSADCRRIGKKVPFWTQGAGGNVSLKQGESLWIKASGFRLSSVTADAGIVEVDLKEFLQQLDPILETQDKSETAYNEALWVASPNGGRPSMETGFHAVLPCSKVYHFHSLSALLMAHEFKSDPVAFRSWLSKYSGFEFGFVPPALPGLTLIEAIVAMRHLSVLILENHGVILQSDRSDVLNAWEEIETQFLAYWGYSIRPDGVSLPRIPAPFRIYFPDAAVFLKRILKVIAPMADTGLYLLNEDAYQVDRDAAEIWEATALLFRACPHLPELPREISDTVADLPSEIWRQKVAGVSQ